MSPQNGRIDEHDDAIHGIRERLVALESDVRWIKWVATAGAASAASNLLLSHAPATALIVGGATFVGAVIADVLTHLR